VTGDIANDDQSTTEPKVTPKKASSFFDTEPRDGDAFYAPGIRLIRRGEIVGSICQIRSTKMFDVAVVDRDNNMYQAEFETLEKADRFAWCKVKPSS
jgi:hypothetical protein